MRYMKAAFLMGLILLLSACGSEQIDDFSYTDHRGETVSLESLKGTPWLATFVFTNCETVCPPMTFNMAGIQEELVKQGIEDYKIIAFSVDPKEDTPEKMEQYLKNFSVPDESKWHLLTGYSQQEISDFAVDNFKTLVKDDPNSNQVIHGTSFYLMDKEGAIANNYDGFTDVPVEEITKDLKALIEK
ncbi:SCO family protein [Planococcus shenhongbingii]|uniref:SCO family protein n=1 Tax=Planococcus shenhongbingii TaxID=3058398 RepID=A0ABT8NDV4_9BACL|nr:MULTISPECIES: SCO family protein [unclassified Planococcus (in: firmicutes)]MDN7245690.1 SCO family protein [Planococcus sp. N017]WKA60192.1 SCO family protein [Planococcus sp. N016]